METVVGGNAARGEGVRWEKVSLRAAARHYLTKRVPRRPGEYLAPRPDDGAGVCSLAIELPASFNLAGAWSRVEGDPAGGEKA